MITNQEAVRWAIQRGLISVRPPLSIDADAYKRRLADQRRPKPSPSGPTTGFNPQRADSRNKPPEQAGEGKPHGLKGAKGNNQTRRGANHRYVIQAKDLKP